MTISAEKLLTELGSAHDDLVNALTRAHALYEVDEQLALDFYCLWNELLQVPDFKPGRSNVERDIKMRAFYPEFMTKWDKHQQVLSDAKFQLELARLRFQFVQNKIAIVANLTTN